MDATEQLDRTARDHSAAGSSSWPGVQRTICWIGAGGGCQPARSRLLGKWPRFGVLLTGWLVGILVVDSAQSQPFDATGSPPARSQELPQNKRSVENDLTGESRRAAAANTVDGPSGEGQQWRVYDLRWYAKRMRGYEKPLHDVIDWILRETGTDRWFGDTPGMIQIDGGRLRVYHVPEVHRVVDGIVQRYADPATASRAVSASLVTVESVSWRAFAMPLMQPIRVNTPGIDAWTLSRENASLLMDHLRRRVDFRAHSASGIRIRHGQSHTIQRWQPRTYPRSVQQTPAVFPGYQVQAGQLREGYSLKISPLFQRVERSSASSERRSWVEAVVQVRMQQIEKLASLWLDVPEIPGQPNRVEIQVPQLASWQVQERFRWPRDQVLLVSRGMVGLGGVRPDSAPGLGRGLVFFANSPARVDALLLLQCVEIDEPSAARPAALQATRINYHDRY